MKKKFTVAKATNTTTKSAKKSDPHTEEIKRYIRELNQNTERYIKELSNDTDRRIKELNKGTERYIGALTEDFQGRVSAVAEQFLGVNERLDKMDNRFDKIDNRFDSVDKRLDKMDMRFEGIDNKLDIHTEMIGQLMTDVQEIKTDMKQKVAPSELTNLDKRVLALEIHQQVSKK